MASSSGWRRVARDLRDRRFIDAYSVAIVAFVLAVVSVVGYGSDQLRWTVVLAALGLLVLRITIPETGPEPSLEDLLLDRFAFDAVPLADRFKDAREVWIFAPSGVNLLSGHHCELLRAGPLSRTGGIVRVVVLDPSRDIAVDLASRQLDDSLDYPMHNFRTALTTTVSKLAAMSHWQVAGSFQYRMLAFNPGFSLVAIDPSIRGGRIIVEFHAFYNEATSSRMHVELTRKQSERWFSYWSDQFERIWTDSVTPGA
ncbi:MAG: hypothetical protein JO016_12395 [Actinobacteria bacterium]|nr:hypothetical protein [Actinomycetota bacterium]